MITALYVTLYATLFLELCLSLPFIWRFRRVWSVILLCTLSIATAGLFAVKPGFVTGLICFISVGRMFNLFRLIKNRIKEQYLRSSFLRASAYFAILQAVLLTVSSLVSIQEPLGVVLGVVAVIQTAIGLLLLISTLRSVRKTRHIPNSVHYADTELPTVTVAIPARNETQDLEACLQGLIGSDYQKLEILVLDDCSHDHTPELIKGFAHDGVRFVKGAEPDDNWMPKNAAYERLFKEANGELILFCGVDTRFVPTTVRALVTTMLNKNKQMISVMPRRMTQSTSHAVIQPMRYWWELALPRRLFNRPPVLSTCWIINRKALKDLGGFAAWKRTIMPEALIARELTKQDGYSFVRADDELNVETRKNWQEQRDTAIRMRYPQLHRRPELAFGLLFLEFLVLCAPTLVLISSLVLGEWIAAVFSLIALILLLITHFVIVSVSNPPHAPVSLFNFPLVVFSELLLGFISMYRYEFSIVDWKGRNICVPAMRVIPHLPVLEDSKH